MGFVFLFCFWGVSKLFFDGRIEVLYFGCYEIVLNLVEKFICVGFIRVFYLGLVGSNKKLVYGSFSFFLFRFFVSYGIGD